MEKYKLSKVAKDLKITKQTLWNWKAKGYIDFCDGPVEGYRYIDKETYQKLMGIEERKSNKVVIYCRVSSSKNKSNLETQRDRLISFANAKGLQVHKVVEEIGSGFNDKRSKLQSLLEKGDFDTIIVEHKDRLCRAGFNYLAVLLKQLDKKIIVVNEVDTDKASLIEDFVSIITSYSARIYGQRRNKRKTEKIIKSLESNELV